MSFDFTVENFILGGSTSNSPFTFYRRGFKLGGGNAPTWQDIKI